MSYDPTKLQVDNFVRNRIHLCGNYDLSNFIRLVGRKSRNKTYLFLKSNLPDIAIRLDESSAWTLSQVCFILYGQQTMIESDEGLLRILSIMTKAMKQILRSDEVVLPRNISMILLGLQSNQCTQTESKEFLSVLAEVINKIK